jgi:hypothetical protein
MNILEQTLLKINGISKKQRIFLMVLIHSLIGSFGKKTFKNLARYAQTTQHTILRQMAKAFNFVQLNALLIKTITNEHSTLIAVQDATFIPKAGKKTHGLGFFWNGSAGRPEKGLEYDVIAVVDVGNDKNEGYALSAEQTPANPMPKKERKKTKKTDVTRVDAYLSHLARTVRYILGLGIKYVVADAFFAKDKYVNGAAALELHVISKLRIDARLTRPYTGPQKPRGRKKIIDNMKISPEDYQDSIMVTIGDEQVELSSCKAYCASLKRVIRVVRVRKMIKANRYKEALLFSTDVDMDMRLIYQFYVARFQIEFVFRDAKGATGLADCQSRNAQRQHYHVNASLVALNVIKIQDHEVQQKHKTQYAFSATNWTRKYHVEIVLNRFISMFEFDQTFIKSHPDYNNILEFGSVKH